MRFLTATAASAGVFMAGWLIGGITAIGWAVWTMSRELDAA